MWLLFLRFAQFIRSKFQRGAAPLHSAKPTVADIYAAGLVPPPEQPTAGESLNRKQRRAVDSERRKFERERRKFDKFVEPKGPTPIKIERSKPEKKPQPKDKPEPGTFVDYGDDFIVSVHHSDYKTRVLYDNREILGEFNFRDTILEQLERYWFYLDRMKKHDANAYGFYKQVGITLIPYARIPDVWHRDPDWNESKEDFDPSNIKITPWFNATRPAFGCVAYGANPAVEKIELNTPKKHGRYLIIPKFMYFSKYQIPPWELQRMSGGDIYKMTIWWDRPDDPRWKKDNPKYGSPEEFGIFISRDGTKIQLLRQLNTELFPIPTKKNCGPCYIPQRAWRIPNHYEQWAKRRGTNAQTMLSALFCDSAQRIEHSAYAMVRVNVSKGERSASFGIDPRRTPYFFQDRDIELNKHGHKKRIFHLVKPYQRADGSYVGFQFRGERKFTWASYDVLITVPGRDHLMPEEIDIGVIDERDAEPGEEVMTEPTFGKIIATAIKEGLGGTASTGSFKNRFEEILKEKGALFKAKQQ